ncbi:MAG TPA: carboxypeptidase-like regulatory domain-containing protein [Bryobacteraceae bacterium]|nr:carboxypeptidase-like regulatory domain-containing protein [Bryobacteraceae bacterium]
MTGKRKILSWILAIVIVCAAAISLRVFRSWPRQSSLAQVSLTGAVLRRDSDPQKQSPIANVRITATGGLSSVDGLSDSSGFFNLTLRPGVLPGQPVTLTFEHAQYEPLETTAVPQGQLHVVRMKPVESEPVTKLDQLQKPAKVVEVKNVRVRYSSKNQTTINVGSFGKQFEVVNTGNVRCGGHPPCSPDGKYKAATGSLSIDAQEGNLFRNVRVSCIGGPCPFTKIEPDDLTIPARKMKISVLNWSDTAAFLIEAEVTRTMVTNMVQLSYPFTVGQTMTFALPADAEGTSIQADLNGEQIIFPLGPKLVLSWATCSVELAPGHNKIYRCELKPGYQFQQ